MVRRNPNAELALVGHAIAPSQDGANHDAISIELLPEDVRRQCTDSPVRFYDAEEIVVNALAAKVSEALQTFAIVPTLAPTICCLIRSLHLMDPKDDNVDVSFSDPDLPFSAFVSIPGPNAKNGPLRIAEAMLHEAMHLELTLIERLIPLVKPTATTYYSPWRVEYRSPLGVLHALYVFRAIDSFLGALLVDGPDSVDARDYRTTRLTMIGKQLNEVEGFAACEHLTADGAALVTCLLAERTAHNSRPDK